MTQAQIEEMLATGDLVDDRQNRRVKLHLYDRTRLKEYDQMLRQVAEKSGATKLIVYGKKRDVAEWLALGYRQEGVIDGFFKEKMPTCSRRM